MSTKPYFFENMDKHECYPEKLKDAITYTCIDGKIICNPGYSRVNYSNWGTGLYQRSRQIWMPSWKTEGEKHRCQLKHSSRVGKSSDLWSRGPGFKSCLQNQMQPWISAIWLSQLGLHTWSMQWSGVWLGRTDMQEWRLLGTSNMWLFWRMGRAKMW